MYLYAGMSHDVCTRSTELYRFKSRRRRTSYTIKLRITSLINLVKHTGWAICWFPPSPMSSINAFYLFSTSYV